MPKMVITLSVHAQQGVKQSHCLSVCRSFCGQRNIETADIHVRCYLLQKGTIRMFALFWEGHSADSVIYNLLELQIPSFLISYYSSPALPL